MRPKGCGVAQPARTKLQAHQGCKGVFGRSAAGTAAADHFAQCSGRGEVRGGSGGDFVHPAFHQGQGSLQPLQGRILRRGPLRLEHAAGQRRLDGLGIGRIDVPGGFLDLRNVDVDSAGVALDGAEQVGGQPRGAGEQPGMCSLPHRQVEPDFSGGNVQAFAEGGNIGRQQGHGPGGQRKADVGGADHFLGQGTHGLAKLDAEHGTAHVGEHGRGPAHHRLHFLRHLGGDGIGQCLGDADGHRLGQAPPGVHGGLHPFGTRPCLPQRGR